MAITSTTSKITFTYEVGGVKKTGSFEGTPEATAKLNAITRVAQKAISENPALKDCLARVSNTGEIRFYNKEGNRVRSGNDLQVSDTAPIFRLFNEKIQGVLKETAQQQTAYDSSEAHATPTPAKAAAETPQAAIREGLVDDSEDEDEAPATLSRAPTVYALPDATSVRPAHEPSRAIPHTAPAAPRPAAQRSKIDMKAASGVSLEQLMEMKREQLKVQLQSFSFDISQILKEHQAVEEKDGVLRNIFGRPSSQTMQSEQDSLDKLILLARQNTNIKSLIATENNTILFLRLEIEKFEKTLTESYKLNLEARKKLADALVDRGDPYGPEGDYLVERLKVKISSKVKFDKEILGLTKATDETKLNDYLVQLKSELEKNEKATIALDQATKALA